MANLTPAPPVAADAKNRAARTFVQGLLVALVIDVSRVAYEILSSSDGPVQWSVLGYALLRTALLALVAFGMRLQLPPPDDLTPEGVYGPIRPVHYRRPRDLGRALLELLASPFVALYVLTIPVWLVFRFGTTEVARPAVVPALDPTPWWPSEIHVTDAVEPGQMLMVNPQMITDLIGAPVPFDAASFGNPGGRLGAAMLTGIPVTGAWRADGFDPITGS